MLLSEFDRSALALAALPREQRAPATAVALGMTFERGRESMREAVRHWLESKSAGVTPGRLLEDLDKEVPL